MPNETAAPQLKPMRDFRDQLPGHRKGSRCHLSTLIRWATDGVKTPAGPVRLRAVRVGCKWLTTDEWFQEFVAALTTARLPQPAVASAPPVRPSRAPRFVTDSGAAARAAAVLEAMGA